MNKFSLLLAGTALALPNMAFAQSTGTIDFEKENAIVVTGSRLDDGVGGVVAPDTSKTRQAITDELIQRQSPGQTINDTINLMPGVSFQNNDAFGSSGGTLTIRGFDNTRISQTFDGIPLNDTGNYALYSNQQLDPELIQQVNVSLGSTDVDSPTASATGSTVNYRSRNPSEDFHVRLQGSAGDSEFFRLFGVVDTGNFTPWGTRAWFAASKTTYHNPYFEPARIDKQQFNAKIYQPLGDGGDFVALSGHYNRNRNNNFSSVPLRIDTTQSPTNSAPRVVGSGSGNRFPLTRDERDYSDLFKPCQTDAPQAGAPDTPNSCGTAYDYSFNPSNTGNVRLNSRFTLAEGLVLTVDPSFSYTLANGGASAVKGNEGAYGRAAPLTGIFGYIGGQPYFGGVDLNGDGDILDTYATGSSANNARGVELYAPSTTQTNRYVIVSSLRYEINDTQTVRLNYTYDRGRHRQTGEVGYLRQNGFAAEFFPRVDPILDVNGKVMQKRNRKSFATLQQVSGEYRGEFVDGKLVVNAGLRAPFFKRDLTNYCVTESGGNGFVDCFNDAASQAAFLAANPSYAAPQNRVFKYSKVLPNAGFTFDLAPKVSLYANYSKGLQVPGTDNLYNSFAFSRDTDRAKPDPETTDNFDLGLRYRSGKVQAQLAGWYTAYQNRLASAYDPELDTTVYRNLGKVEKYGIDGSIAYQPVADVVLYGFGSYLKSEIQDDVITGECTAAQVTSGANGCTAVGQPILANTAGKRESGAPVYTFGGRVEARLGPVEFGVQAKRTGPRYVNDVNLPVTSGGRDVYPAKTPAYTLVDLDARLPLAFAGLNDRTYLQFNLRNLFDKLYVSGFSGNLSNASVRNAYIGAPRTFMATLVVGF